MMELLAPAGNTETLDAAVSAGADAVYLGLKSFNARMRSENFTWAQYAAAAEALHKRGIKVFVTVNTVIEEAELESLYRLLAFLDRNRPDGIIVQDFGALSMARSHFPRIRVHASTQMNVSSARAVNLLSRAGVSRVVLSRELSLAEIREIRTCVSCELEVFVHGALCASESGLCLFSSFFGGKSANRGMCTQACRRLYSAEGGEGKSGLFFSTRDLQLIDAVPDLESAGVNALKIEGRLKSAEYVGAVVSAYRYMLDNWEKDRRAAAAAAKRILADDFAREKTRCWLDSAKPESLLNPEGPSGTGIFLGVIERTKSGSDARSDLEGEQLAAISGNAVPEAGDTIRLHKKGGERRESWKIKTVAVEEGRGGKTRWIGIPQSFSKGDEVYLLQTRAMSRRFPRVLPKSLEAYKDRPRQEALPPLEAERPRGEAGKKKGNRHQGDPFPEGVYVQVSSPQDFYHALLLKPVRIAAEMGERMLRFLLGKGSNDGLEGKPLPVSKNAVIVSLPPFFPQSEEKKAEEAIAALIDAGYRAFIANNAGHLGLLRSVALALKSSRGDALFIAAGPYLYSFNSRAAAWLRAQGAIAFVSPYENSRKNLESAFPQECRQQVILPVFAYPALFRMRFGKPESYDFEWFSNKRDEFFRLAECESGGSVVHSDIPYSIADKKALLDRLGFRRVLFDFSNARLSKQEFRAVSDSWKQGIPLKSSSRFNWKEGFYSPEMEGALQKGKAPSASNGAGKKKR